MRKIPFKFRWPVQKTGECTVDVVVPTGPNGTLILDEGFVKLAQLSQDEVDQCEAMVLRATAIVPDAKP